MIDQDWRPRAACRNHPHPDLWFPTGTEDVVRDAAVAICETCPVRAECLADAMRGGQRSAVRGIWGGTTELEREELARHGWRPVLPRRRATR